VKKRNRSSVELVNGIVLDIFKLNGYFIKAADCLTRGSDFFPVFKAGRFWLI